MSCPTCDHTMEKLTWADVWLCPRCGTVRQELEPPPGQDEPIVTIYVPKLVERCRVLEGAMIDAKEPNGLAVLRELGITESINVPEDRP